jgi:hypothetical protein
MSDKTIGRLYSRKNGWENGLPIKVFHSDIIKKLPNLETFNLDGKNSITLINFLIKNNLIEEYSDLYNNCKKYSCWYFYYGEMKELTSQESL